MSAVLNWRLDGWPPDAVLITRPGILSNPYVIGRDGSRQQVIDRFELYARARIVSDPAFLKAILDTEGRDLLCCCRPLPCHGEVIVRLRREVMG